MKKNFNRRRSQDEIQEKCK